MKHGAPIITVRGLRNAFGEQVVHENLDLDVCRGEILGVVGGSGTGKSVLLRSIIGLQTPDAGEIEVLGENMIDRTQIGLALMAVRDWANANVVGGASARGFGRFEAQLALFDGDTQLAPSIFAPGDHATAYRLSDDVASYVQAAQAELDALTVEAMEAAYPSVVGKAA